MLLWSSQFLELVLKGVDVEHPTVQRNGDAELVFVIALAADGAEGKTLAAGQVEQWAGSGQERRRLIEDAVEAAEDPLQTRDLDGDAKTGGGHILHDRIPAGDCAGIEVRIAKAGDQGQPCRWLIAVAKEEFRQTAGHGADEAPKF